MLKPGDIAPDFTFGDRSLKGELAKGPAIVYLYPRDFTPVCTKEACMFRDVHEGLAAAGVTVIGISPQDQESHDRFRQKHGLPFFLVADTDLAIAKAYGAVGIFGLPIPFGVRRVTFLVGRDQKVIDRATGELGVGEHRRIANLAAVASQ